ncbi:uroporphyrinogen-III C-methyltransferase [Sinisalibacter lacisalsi]|uniref:uroporphyrinogen-III C-methyltransferase n=1 Tax=Sinisalibacter lacisalsi TaxID=1526570 RepID=UPI00166AB047|nr:uroporphyrinogen-III C-methyltransferase [Sinisalibacter lacisalsi]
MTDSLLPAGDWPEMLPGWVWLVGAGPGDPGLLTLHALNALRQAEVIVHDALVAPAILDWANPAATLIDMGKRGGTASPKQRDISLELVDLARAGKRVLRLKGGDPFVFGRGGEEGQTLVQHGVPIRLVPGISAGIGGLAYAGIPVTHRDVNASLTFVTGHDPSGHAPQLDWSAIARGSAVIVIYMGMRNLDDIAARLMAAGRAGDEPVAIVQSATTPDQRVLETRLDACAAEAEAAGIGAPAIVCVGRAALLRQALDWQAMVEGATPRNPDPLGLGPAEGA